jgi:hypothetical protein|tara:strand:+ start:137 stop:496 length:360 start_codon:yes stop_codon:yes gene_type:complete
LYKSPTGVIVVERLIDKSLTAAIDHERPRSGTLSEEKSKQLFPVYQLVWKYGGRTPPSFLHIAHVSACLSRNGQTIAPEPWGAGDSWNLSTQMLDAQIPIAFKATCSKNDRRRRGEIGK